MSRMTIKSKVKLTSKSQLKSATKHGLGSYQVKSTTKPKAHLMAHEGK